VLEVVLPAEPKQEEDLVGMLLQTKKEGGTWLVVQTQKKSWSD
jgi:hypothetical protein